MLGGYVVDSFVVEKGIVRKHDDTLLDTLAQRLYIKKVISEVTMEQLLSWSFDESVKAISVAFHRCPDNSNAIEVEVYTTVKNNSRFTISPTGFAEKYEWSKFPCETKLSKNNWENLRACLTDCVIRAVKTGE